MDDRELIVDAEMAPRTSVEKIIAMADELASSGSLGWFGAVLPMARAALPTDPAELDQMLLYAAKTCFELRSDGAWQPEDLDELWLGPNPQPESQEDDHAQAHDY